MTFLPLIVVRITSARDGNGFHNGQQCPSLGALAGIACTEAEGVRVKAICLSERALTVGDVVTGTQLAITCEGMNVVGVT